MFGFTETLVSQWFASVDLKGSAAHTSHPQWSCCPWIKRWTNWVELFTLHYISVCYHTSHNRFISPYEGLLVDVCLVEVSELLTDVSKCPCSLVNPFLLLYWAGGAAAGLSLGSWSASDCLRACVWIRQHAHCLWCPSWAEVCLHAPEIERQLRAAMHSEGRAGQAGRAHWPRPQLSTMRDGLLSGARG